MDSNEVMDHKDKIIEKYKGMNLGRLYIKEYPTNTASIFTIRSHIERLDLKGFKPDIIIIDYADIMRSTRQFDSLRHELKLVYEELRGLAMELGVPIWTASQSNKEGANSEIIDMTNMSEAYGKAMICDFIISVSRRPHEKASGWGRLFVAKNRAGRDGLVFPAKINTAQSKFEITGAADTPEETSSSDEAEQKKALRAKWKELKSEFTSSRNFSSSESVTTVGS
jgi:replicative DNA helicase